MKRPAVIAIAGGLAALAVAAVAGAHAAPGAGSIRAVAADAQGRWIDHACWDCVLTVLATDDVVWVGTESAGVVRHDLRTGAVSQFGLSEGLGGRAVDWLALAPDGDLWAATRVSLIISPHSGVSHFDGTVWKAFDAADGFPAGDVTDIAAGPGGTAWVAAQAGLLHYDGAAWQLQSLPLMADGSVAPARAVTIAPNGDVYAVTGAGVVRNDGSGWQDVPADGLPSLGVARMKADAAGRVWAIVGTGAAQLDLAGWPSGTHWQFHELRLANEYQRTRRIEITRDGAVWIFNAGSIWHYDGAEWTYVSASISPAPVDGWPMSWDVSPNGSLWTGYASGGLAVWDGATWAPHEAAHGPTNMIAFAITVDTADDIWAGFMPFLSQDNLVNRFDGANWQHFGTADGMLSGRGTTLGVQPNCIDAGTDGSVWVGVDEVGVAEYSAGSWVTTPITDIVGATARIYAVEADDHDGAWVGTDVGAVHFDGNRWSRFAPAAGLPSAKVESIVVQHTPGGDVVWFGTDAGAARWDGIGVKTFTTADGLASNEVSGIAFDSAGSVWFVARGYVGGGVTRFDGTSWRTFTTADGLPVNGGRAVTADPRGGVWLASDGYDTSNVGVSRFDGTAWRVYSSADGLIQDDVFDIAVDSRGHVWFATLGGISEFRPEEPAPTPTPTATPTATPGPPALYLPRAERP